MDRYREDYYRRRDRDDGRREKKRRRRDDEEYIREEKKQSIVKREEVDDDEDVDEDSHDTARASDNLDAKPEGGLRESPEATSDSSACSNNEQLFQTQIKKARPIPPQPPRMARGFLSAVTWHPPVS